MPEPNSGAPAPARRRFIRNAITSYGQSTLLALSALLLTPFLFRRLGTGGFGTWSVMFTLTTVFNMIEIGFAQGPTKFIAEHRAREHRGETEAILGASVVIMGALGLVALGVSLLLAIFATGLAAPGDQDAFRAGMLVLGVSYVLRFPLVAYGAVLTGYQRYDLLNVGQAVMILGSSLGAVVAVLAGTGIFGIAVAFSAASIAGGLTYALLAKRLDPELRLLPRRSDRSRRRTVLTFSSFTLLADSMILIGARLDTVVVAALRSASAAAPFAAASKLQSGLQSLTLPVIDLMLPMVSDLEARGMRDAVIERLLVATRVTLQVTLPVALAVAFFSADIVDVWLGPSAPNVTAAIITVLALHTLMQCETPAQRVLVGLGRASKVGGLNTVWGILNLAISIVLVSAYGAIGAALGTLIASCLVGPVYFPLVCRATGYPLRGLIRRSLWLPLVSSVPSVAVMLAVWLAFSPGLGRLFFGSFLGIAVAALVGLLQLGPRRAISVLRSELRTARPDPAASQLVAQDPA